MLAIVIPLAKYKGKFNFNYYKFDQNRGSTSLVSHWQRCINLTQDEDWIMILGDDDTLEANFVAEFYTNLQDSTEYNVIRFGGQIFC